MFLTTGTWHARFFPSLLWKMDAPGIYLTFDDGPHSHATPRVLGALARHDVQATFFLSGSNIEGRERIVRSIADSGHTIGLHAWTHTRMLAASRRRTIDEIRAVSHAIEQLTDATPTWFRPPFGFFSWNTINAAREAGCRIAMWTIMPGDFKPWSDDAVIERTMKGLCEGAIVVLHDNALTEHRCARLLDALIPRIKDRGYALHRLP